MAHLPRAPTDCTLTFKIDSPRSDECYDRSVRLSFAEARIVITALTLALRRIVLERRNGAG